jgi:hypothetical protein
MAKLPNPGNPLPLPAQTVLARTGDLYWRIYTRGAPYPSRWDEFRRYGPLLTARFDHHAPPPSVKTQAILYAAAEVATTVAEFFQSTRRINRSRRSPWLCGFRLVRDVSLLDLSGTWATAAGASMLINSGRRSASRLWSQAIYRDYPRVEGLFYGSSMHGNRPCIALYERAITAMPAAPAFDRPLLDPNLESGLKRIAVLIQYKMR